MEQTRMPNHNPLIVSVPDPQNRLVRLWGIFITPILFVKYFKSTDPTQKCNMGTGFAVINHLPHTGPGGHCNYNNVQLNPCYASKCIVTMHGLMGALSWLMMGASKAGNCKKCLRCCYLNSHSSIFLR